MSDKYLPTPIHLLKYTDGKNAYYIKHDDLLHFLWRQQG